MTSCSHPYSTTPAGAGSTSRLRFYLFSASSSFPSASSALKGNVGLDHPAVVVAGEELLEDDPLAGQPLA
jgi:hypothetical protein